MPEPLIRSISDTARWVAFHRATESERADAIFHDPYARPLAGERGEAIARVLKQNAWAISIRTYHFDKLILELLGREAIEMVVNLAAGLDSRPYRLELPRELQWVEVDLPEILDPKREVLESAKPCCRLDVITQHLGEEAQRRELFSQLNRRSQNTLVLSEGLLVYLDEDRVSSLAADLRAQPNFKYWMVEVIPPPVLDYITRKWGHHFRAANAPMGFAPADWRKFYSDRGWQVVEFENMAKTARALKREPGMMKFFRTMAQVFPAWGEKQRKLWEGGVALLRRA